MQKYNGLQNSNYINFEIIIAVILSVEHKFIVSNVNKDENSFYINEAVDFDTDNTMGFAKMTSHHKIYLNLVKEAMQIEPL